MFEKKKKKYQYIPHKNINLTMKWIRPRIDFLLKEEAKIKDVLLPPQAKQLSTEWGAEYLELEEIEPTDQILQGVWKLSKDDKIECFSSFFNTDIKEMYKVLSKIPDRFVSTIKLAVDEKSCLKMYGKENGPKIYGIMQRADFKEPSIDAIFYSFENIFNLLSVSETKASEVIERDDTGKPVIDPETNKPKKIVKEVGEPVFSTNVGNLFTFITAYNRCYDGDDKVPVAVSDSITDGSMRSIKGMMGSAENYIFEVDIFEKDLFLQIKHDAKDILNMSISKFFTSCQNLYTGGYRSRLYATVFDTNSIPAFLKFDSPIYRDGVKISSFLPLARVILRYIESAELKTKDGSHKLYFDTTYPGRMSKVIWEMVEKYSKNKLDANFSGRYVFAPDMGEIEPKDVPYMDRLANPITNKVIGVNTKVLYLSKKIDWTKVKILPKAKIKEVIIETVKLPEDFVKLNLNIDAVKFKLLELNTIKELNMKFEKVIFDRCQVKQEVLNDLNDMENVKSVIFEVCEVDGLDLTKLKTVEELGFIFSLDDSTNLEEKLAGASFKKLTISGDLFTKNRSYLNSLKKKGIKIETIGPVIK